MKNTKTQTQYYIKLGSNTFVGRGFYHWVSGSKKAAKFSLSQVREMIAHILSVAPDAEAARLDIKVVPVSGGFKLSHNVGL